MIEPTPGVERVVENERAHVVSGANQSFREVRTDETISAGDQYFPQAMILSIF